jgi:tripartite motif-containing protein 71
MRLLAAVLLVASLTLPAYADDCVPQYLQSWSMPLDPTGIPVGIQLGMNNEVYVCEFANFQMLRFSQSGNFELSWGGHDVRPRLLSWGGQPACTASNTISCLDFHRLRRFTPDGAFIEDVGDGEFEGKYLIAPAALTTGIEGSILICDTENDRIVVLSANGEFQETWGSQGSGQSQFSKPTGLCTDALGYVYVCDFGNNRIQKFDGSGTFVLEWGTPGSEVGQFNSPALIASSPTGELYVTDMGNNRIQSFDPSGNVICSFGEQGAGPGQFQRPTGIAVNGNGMIFVADSDNHRIQIFSAPSQVPTQQTTWSGIKSRFLGTLP